MKAWLTGLTHPAEDCNIVRRVMRDQGNMPCFCVALQIPWDLHVNSSFT